MLRFAILFSIAALPAMALTEADLRAEGYQPLTCLFDERCVIGQPCEPAYREFRWLINDDTGSAYPVRDRGTIGRKLPLMKDARWKDRSEARAILSPMREAVAGHLTVFDGGGSVYSLQYAGNPGAGQTFLGQCEIGDAIASRSCRLEEICSDEGDCAERSVTLHLNDDPDTIRVDDTRAGVSRLDAGSMLDTIRVGSTDWAIRAGGSTLFLTGKNLSGTIVESETAGVILATFLTFPDRRGNVSTDRRVFSGQCEALF